MAARTGIPVRPGEIPGADASPEARRRYDLQLRSAVHWMLDKLQAEGTTPVVTKISGDGFQAPAVQFGDNLYDTNGNLITAVTGDLIASGAITEDHMSDDSVGPGALQNASVQSDHIANGSVMGEHVSLGTLNNDHVINDQKLVTSLAVDGSFNVDIALSGVVHKTLTYIGDGPGRVAAQRYQLANNTGAAVWMHVGTLVIAEGNSAAFGFHAGAGYTGAGQQQTTATVVLRTGNNATAPNLSGISIIEHGAAQGVMAVKAKATGGSTSITNNSWELYFQLNSFCQGPLDVVLSVGDVFTFDGSASADPGAGSSSVVVATGGRFINPTAGTGLDGVIEGGTYGKVKLTALTSGQVDLANAGVVNKTGAYISYTAGGTVDSLKPQEVGANVTETRTSNDTSNVSGKASVTVKNETNTYLTVRSQATFNVGVSAAAAWYTVAKMPGDGAGNNQGAFALRIGVLGPVASVGSYEYTFLVGFTGPTAGAACKLLFNQQTLASVFNNWRIRFDAATGNLYFDVNLNGIAAGALPFTVDVEPHFGTNPRSAVASTVASVGTQILTGAFVIGSTGVHEGIYNDTVGGATHEYTRNGVHTIFGVSFSNNVGMLSSQLVNQPLVGPGYNNSYWTGITITPHPTSLNASAGTLHLGGDTVSYSSSSKTGLPNSTTESLFYVDANLSGGSVALSTTTSKQTLINSNSNVYLCDATTQSAGGTGGGGGVGSCVGKMMLLNPRLRARLAHINDWLDVAQDYKLIGRSKVHNASMFCEPCVRMVAANGAALVCSNTTPFTVPDGTTVMAPDMKGQKVLTDKGESEIVEVTDAGTQHVVKIDCGGLSYAAGEDGSNRIYSHNTQKP